MKSIPIEVQPLACTKVPVRVLILEDSLPDTKLILNELREGGYLVEYVRVETLQDFLVSIAKQPFDAVLADYRLPGWAGMDAFREMRKLQRDIPFLLVTGSLGEEAAVECVKEGISDYVPKEHISRLPLALRRSLNEKALRDEAARTHAALAESEALARKQFAELELLYHTLPVALALFDRNLRFLRVNEALGAAVGLPVSEIAGKCINDIAPDFAGAAEPLIQRVFDSGKSILNVELRGATRLRPAKDQVWLCSYYPARNEQGSVFAVHAVGVDITERKRAEEALRESEARNRDVVENAVYGIGRATAKGEFREANPALLRMLGCSSLDEIRKLDLTRDVFRYPEQFTRLLGQCREQGPVHGAETEWKRRDGGIFTARLNLRSAPVSGSESLLEIIAEDVTELRAMERQLRQSQKFEAIGQLAGGVAHDFNNVIGAILGWAELGIEEARESPLIVQKFARIREQADRAAALTCELLAFARRQVLQPRAVDLNEVVGGLLSLLDKVIGKHIELKVNHAPLEPVRADPTQIEQVLMNLCLNARDAMADGGRLLIDTEMVELDDTYCRFYSYVMPGRYVVLSVSDTGVGMDTETRERIFEPFFTTKEPGQGTGMGLATVYGIVKQHGGFIHVYSEPGHGSLFRVYLPVLEQAHLRESRLARADVASPARGGKETILLAEDHDAIREMARQALVGLGYRVLSAADGEEALRLCRDESPALAILDVVMPRLGGTAAAAELRKKFPQLAILFTSGYLTSPEIVSAWGSSARFMQKPYSPTTLGRMTREILDGAAANRAATGS